MADRIDILARILACGPHMQDVHDAVEELMDASEEVLKAEWMVTHDWGGDRESVLNRALLAHSRVRPLNMVSNEEGS